MKGNREKGEADRIELKSGHVQYCTIVAPGGDSLELEHELSLRAGKAEKFEAEVERMEEELSFHLRHRVLKDEDNQRLLDGIGLQHDRGRILLFLHDPTIEPTNNRGERSLRPAVIVRKLSHGSKNERGAEACAGFTSVIQTAAKKQDGSIIDARHGPIRRQI